MRGAEAMAEADQLTRVATGRRDQQLTSVRPRERRAARGDGTEILLPCGRRAASRLPSSSAPLNLIPFRSVLRSDIA